MKEKIKKRNENLKKLKEKKGQVTLFIVIGIIILVAVIAGVYFYGKFKVTPEKKLDPFQYSELCAKEAVEKSVEKIIEGGGRVNPTFFVSYLGQNYNYLCFADEKYKSCTFLYPKMKYIVEQEIKKDTQPQVEKCLLNLKQELEKEGYTVKETPLKYEIELAPKTVLIKIDKKIEISRKGDNKIIESFSTSTLSPLYNLVFIAREIVISEMANCYFDYDLYMNSYPEILITRTAVDKNRIYTLRDLKTGKQFKFAVQNCILPGGF